MLNLAGMFSKHFLKLKKVPGDDADDDFDSVDNAVHA